MSIATDAAVREGLRLAASTRAACRIWHVGPAVVYVGSTDLGRLDQSLPELPRPQVMPNAEFWRNYLEWDLPVGEKAPGEAERDGHDLLRIRCLHALVERTRQPWAYWFHCGDNGLIHEYSFGVGREPMIHFNDDESRKPRDASGAASSLTAALRYLGLTVPDYTETQWVHWAQSRFKTELVGDNA